MQNRPPLRARATSRATKRTLGIVLLSSVAAQSTGSLEIRSENERFLARIRLPDDLEVLEVAQGKHVPSWSARKLALAPANRWFLTDNGRTIAAVTGETPLVQVVRGGERIASIGAPALGFPSDHSGKWLWEGVESSVLLRRVERGGEPAFRLDLLGQDGRVRSVDLESGTVRLPEPDGIPGPLRVEPAAGEGAEPAFVGEWFAPEVILAPAPFPVHVRGGMPNPGWRFSGFALEPAGAGTLVLRPLAMPPAAGTIAPQVLRGYDATASILGLRPGAWTVRLRGRGEGGDAAGPRFLRVLAPGTIAWCERSGGIAGIRESIALYADGRVESESDRPPGRRLWLAADGARSTIARLLSAMPTAPRPRPQSEGADRFQYELAWASGGHPLRVLRDEGNLEAELRALAEGLFRLGSAPASPASPAEYAIDPFRSRIEVKTGSSGIFGVFGHDHRLMVQRLSGTVTVDAGDLSHSTVDLEIDAGSLAVVDDESQEDRPEIEKEMNERVLESARFPRITFRGGVAGLGHSTGERRDVVLRGELSLHGVAREIDVPVHLEFTGEALHATGQVRLKQSQYRISQSSAAGGTVKVADEVKIVIDVTASRGVPRPR